jgi:putative NADPH-quinone reductase
MNCLVVCAHPLTESLCMHLHRGVVDRLKTSGHRVVIEDLYGAGFEPRLTDAERSTYYGAVYDASEMSAQVQRLVEAEALVLLFPTWWYGFPAILKGWFDRVWGPGIAFDHANDFGPIRPRLSNLRRMLAVTTLGSPWWVDRLVLRQPVRRVLRTAILGACATRCRLTYLSLYNSEKLDEDRVDRFEKRIDRVIAGWSRTAP